MKKKKYIPPADKVEKLTLIGNMGYIAANEDRLLAAMFDGGGGRRWTPPPKKWVPSSIYR